MEYLQALAILWAALKALMTVSRKLEDALNDAQGCFEGQLRML
jgi:hypothetical protein